MLGRCCGPLHLRNANHGAQWRRHLQQVNTFVAGTTITAADHNENWDDLAAKMTNSVAAVGQTPDDHVSVRQSVLGLQASGSTDDSFHETTNPTINWHFCASNGAAPTNVTEAASNGMELASGSLTDAGGATISNLDIATLRLTRPPGSGSRTPARRHELRRDPVLRGRLS